MRITKRWPLAIPYYTSLVLLAYMPFHIFLAQSLSLMTGGLDVWKIAKDLIAVGVVLFVICSVYITGRATRLFTILFGLSMTFGILHAMTWLFNDGIYTPSALLGSVYNLRLPGFLLLGYGTVLLYPKQITLQSVAKLIVIVSTVVALLGIAQFFLPKDVLTHVGYGIDRGTRAAFFIDDKEGLPRIMSTLREPNALGAYLILPAGLLAFLVTQYREKRTKLLLMGVLLLHGIAIALTFSRSAWAGLALVVILVALACYRGQIVRFVRRYWMVLVALVLLLFGGLYVVRNHPLVDSYITHSSDDADLDSNDYHWLFLKQGVEGIIDKPLGHGPGTAGLASIQNPSGSFLTENYYVQVGYEVGLIGLAIFVAINYVVYTELWKRRQSSVAVALLAAFWAYVVVNMVLHIWANEAVACQWWILAGLVIGAVAAKKPKNQT